MVCKTGAAGNGLIGRVGGQRRYPRQSGVIEQLWTMSVDQCTERQAVLPAETVNKRCYSGHSLMLPSRFSQPPTRHQIHRLKISQQTEAV